MILGFGFDEHRTSPHSILKVFRRRWLAEEIALNFVASALPEKERLPCRFDAFSNDAQPQSMAMIAAVIAASSG